MDTGASDAPLTGRPVADAEGLRRRSAGAGVYDDGASNSAIALAVGDVRRACNVVESKRTTKIRVTFVDDSAIAAALRTARTQG